MWSPAPLRRTRRASRALRIVAALGLAATVSPVVMPSPAVMAGQPSGTAATGLARGDRGDGVRRVQRALVDHGIEVAGGVDGIFGPGTEVALRSFQEQEGLAMTGRVDTATGIALGLESSPLLGLTGGSHGRAVTTLQVKLMAAGLSLPGGADGVFGDATAAALRSFQEAEGLTASGDVDVATAGALAGIEVSSDRIEMSDRADTTSSASEASESSEMKEASERDASSAEVEPSASTTPAATGDEPTKASDASWSSSTAPAATSDSPLVGLRIGARGEGVKQLQRLLISAGFEMVGGADGIFGVLTANALSSFQYSVGLEASSVANAATVRALTTAGSDDGTAATSGDSSGGSSDASGSDTSGSSGTASLVGLQYGSNGAAVAYLQQALIDAGISVYGGADGVYGPATVSSVKAYQKAKGIEQSGRVDRATADALAGGSGATGVKKPAPNVMLGLRHGSLGSAVKKLQQAIIDAGVTLRGGADGIFGPATERALKSFQASQGLPANGVVDEATLSALGNPKAPVRTGGGSSTSGTAADGFAAYGEHGARVTALQSALVDAGVPLRGGVDGDFGPATSAAVMEFQQRRGLPVTGKIDAATASALGVEAAAKPKAPDASTLKLAAFPVQGYCQYYDTWLAPRGGGRQHVGVDILAKRGNEVYAVADGTITKLYEDYPGSLAGNGIRLTMSDGTYFFYAHFVSHAKGIRVGAEVTAGQVVGYVGSTGSSSAPHLHFEVHPRGGAAVNPYPIVKAVDDC